MKKTYSIIFLFCVALNITAQDKPDSTLKLEDLQMTNAPSFSLLDVSPSSIERPSTTKAFSASIVNAITQNSGIPQNYAVEFTPFWFVSHPKLSALKYYGVKENGDMRPFSSLGLFSVSFALINNPNTAPGQIAAHNVSFGIRTTLLKIYKKKTRDILFKTNSDWVGALKNASNTGNTKASVSDIDAIEAKVKGSQYGDSIKAHLKDKPIFSIDGASALNFAFNNNSYSSNRLNRYGVWLNANLCFDISGKNNTGKNFFNIYAIGRYLNNSDSLTTDGKYVSVGFLDYGAKAELEFNRLSVAYEYIRRETSEPTPNTFKSVGLIKYKIKDGLYLTGAFGQNFTKVNNLIAVLGINWGLSNGNERVSK
jgi:hypothetical protein